MKALYTRSFKPGAQFLFSTLMVLSVSVVCFLFAELVGHKVVALILLMTVSFIAMLFDILPVMLSAVLSALIWNFFFIPPLFTLHIYDAEDLLMFLLYFAIALINAVLTSRVRKAEEKAREKDEKENTIKLYNTLLNSLSHELKTPIATLIAAVDTLQENNETISPQNRLQLLHEMDKAAMRLNRQVENLLNMSRLETGMLKLNLDWCDTNELINAVIQKLPEPESHRITFNADENLPLFKLDRGLMEQVIYNLLHNALVYAPSPASIEISATQQKENCVIEITDTGRGIPADEAPFIFDKFYRLHNSQTGGSGLGLSIVKGFVEAHQGHIQLAASSGQGATFVISIPAEVSYINNLKNE